MNLGLPMTLRYLHVYRLSNIPNDIWQVGHKRYGRPTHLIGLYIVDGLVKGTRRWHGFEIRVKGEETGTIWMPEEDLARITVTHLGAYRDSS